MERVLSNEERIRRAELVAIRRRLRENGNDNKKESMLHRVKRFQNLLNFPYK